MEASFGLARHVGDDRERNPSPKDSQYTHPTPEHLVDSGVKCNGFKQIGF